MSGGTLRRGGRAHWFRFFNRRSRPGVFGRCGQTACPPGEGGHGTTTKITARPTTGRERLMDSLSEIIATSPDPVLVGIACKIMEWFSKN